MSDQETENGLFRDAHAKPIEQRAEAKDGSSISQALTVIFNSPWPWLFIAIGAAVFALATALSNRDVNRIQAAANEAIVRTLTERNEQQTAASAALVRAIEEKATAEARAAMDKANIAERESRMQQYYLIELDAKLIKQQFQVPDGGYQKFREK